MTSPPEPGERAEHDYTSQEMEIVDPMTNYEIPSSPPTSNTYICAGNKPRSQEKVNQNRMRIENSSDPLAGSSFPNKRQALCEADDFPSLPRPATEINHMKYIAEHDMDEYENIMKNTPRLNSSIYAQSNEQLQTQDKSKNT
ncbi:hypothetical protein GcC1_088023 [Golovinomyces cichoracearum]|uniref:Uncharacterized protein n=1 Tax=Golovinomyces cichoracearum TaxID=62708 RepID=A0A420IGI4_9PEZI|nr:hypothetical protein GcC1_088023 [Golovinomyces cichoracearum]